MDLPVTINPSTVAGPAGHYSHATVANGFVFISDQLPVNAAGARLARAPFEVQAQQVLDNVQEILQGCGSGIEALVQVRVYVDDIANWPAFNALYARWAGGARPARALVPTGPLHFGCKVEAVALV